MYDWDELREKCLACRACGLCEGRTNVVFGTGNEHARLMFVGEGPGRDEDASGIPFVGRAGHLLDDLLTVSGFSRDEVYIANIVKCRPPENRDPLPEEREACIGWLRNQVQLIRPRVIVCLGRIAAGVLLHEDYKITREHGQWIERKGVLMTAVYHPAAVLRNPALRDDVVRDFLEIRKKITELEAKA